MPEVVQPILVSKEGSHANTLLAAAVTSVTSWGLNRELPAWEEWLSGRFTKTVRRASSKDFTKALIWCEENNIAPATIGYRGGSFALALPPMTYDNFPKCVSRLQVSGTDFVRLDTSDDTGDVLLYVDEALTTGKASAQASHALWIASLGTMTADYSQILKFSISVRVVPFAELHAIASHDESFAVIDAGLTEVEPNTLTACAVVNLHELRSTEEKNPRKIALPDSAWQSAEL